MRDPDLRYGREIGVASNDLARLRSPGWHDSPVSVATNKSPAWA